MEENQNQEIQFYRVKDLQFMLRVSRATLWNWIKIKNFPSPIKLGDGCTVWTRKDIETWANKKLRNHQEWQ